MHLCSYHTHDKMLLHARNINSTSVMKVYTVMLNDLPDALVLAQDRSSNLSSGLLKVVGKMVGHSYLMVFLSYHQLAITISVSNWIIHSAF